MKKLFLFSSYMLITVFCFGQNLFSADSSYIKFFSESPLEDIEATNTACRSFINIEKNELAFIVPIIQFKFDSPLMEEHFNENYMETPKFPKATFSGKILGELDLNEDGVHKVSVKGDLLIHGVTKERTIEGKISRVGNRIRIESKFPITVADHDIKIPKLVIKNIAETVETTIQFSYKPMK